MKKVLLLLLGVTASMMIQAQPALTNVWTKSQTGILPVASAKNSNPVAFSAQGDMYVTGLFKEPFSFGTTDLEPIATSAYLLKYGADGSEKWGIELAGAATITAITVDNAGNIYIAGSFADQVIFKGTGEVSITKEGLRNPADNSFYTQQGAGFIAKYAANGTLENVHTFLPTVLPELAQVGYAPEDGDLYFNINSLAFANGKLYASTLYTGQTIDNNIAFKASYLDFFGEGFLFINLAAASVFSLDDDLKVNGKVANLVASEPQIENQIFVRFVSFTVADGKLYSGFVAIGDQTLTIGEQSQKFQLAFGGDGKIEYGYILSAIDLATGSAVVTKKYSTSHDLLGNYCNLKSMSVRGDALLVGGTFNVALPFDNAKVPTSTDDIYLASLNKATLDVNWTAVSGFEEGKINDKEETFNSMALTDDYAYIVGHTASINDHVAKAPLAFWVKLSDGTLTSTTPTDFITGVAVSGNAMAASEYKIVNEKLVNSFTKYAIGDLSSLPSIDQAAKVTAYPNPVVDVLNFTTSCDVEIYNFIGVIVKRASNVTDINVSDLANGQYIVKLTNNEGTFTTKVIKK